MIITSLICLNDDSPYVRAKTLELVKTLESQQTQNDPLPLFTETLKPKSAKKGGTHGDKQDFTPMKAKPMKLIFKDLLQIEREIKADKNQLHTWLNKSQNSKILD